MPAIQHQTRDLFERQTGGKIFCAYVDRQSPVFVAIDLSIPVKVLEMEAVQIQNLYPGSGRVAERALLFVTIS